MINFSAHAVRQGETVEVTVNGILPNSCTKIIISDFYPGNRVYIHDPGHAQLFLEVVTNIESGICIMNTVPFSITKHLHDNIHKDVEVYKRSVDYSNY
ncbi:hypothetical protein HDE68_002014 [Pedobacter cryoconitis]|uniref:Uncharacterized protein n=1 Tax=Pedobacter cryoconitis TaxID=188932 RepID=A0A7W9DYN7_9SPHI|nr:hypothetical protein [Pedobacter cryoconitis]MBB5636126.1 hypothetical protein [Pedobacter cryoconitis]